MRVLAADDEPGMLKALDRHLRSWGYEVELAQDGGEAWRVLKRADAPRVVILDWDMPGLSGLEVCRLLRSTPHGSDVYVLMLTGRQAKTDLIEALESGADDFLSKPFHPRELQLRLAKGISFRETQAIRAPTVAPPSGAVLGGKYRLERKIAEGGMATVWLGVHLSLGINVAIKFMKPHLAETTDFASFEREARAAAQLRNQHIVRVYDHGLTNDGLPYLVMEYLGGESLADRIERQGPLPPLEVAGIIAEVARALTEAHDRGIVHRDVKPENILLVEDTDREKAIGYTAKLIDFGLAKPRGEGAEAAGTPCYMSPEHLRAEAAPNALLDLWGLAATAFFALTATVAFDGPTLADVVARVCAGPLPRPSALNAALPHAIDEWFARACARRPQSRFQSASELSASLGKACAQKLRPLANESQGQNPGVEGQRFGQTRVELAEHSTEPELKAR
jgi:serine/threonine protein kinase